MERIQEQKNEEKVIIQIFEKEKTITYKNDVEKYKGKISSLLDEIAENINETINKVNYRFIDLQTLSNPTIKSIKEYTDDTFEELHNNISSLQKSIISIKKRNSSVKINFYDFSINNLISSFYEKISSLHETRSFEQWFYWHI